MNRNQSVVIFIISLVLLSQFAGCVVTVSPDQYYRHCDKQAELIMADGSRYKLASNWRIDSIDCIRGRGLHIKNDSTMLADVRVPISEVNQLIVVDNITMIYWELAIATAIFIHML